MKKIRIAIVGYGGMGGYHGRQILSDDRYEISGIYDIDESRYEVARADGIANYNRFHSAEDIASDKDTDAVLIATPNDVHAPYVRYFAKAKKNVICEKPVGLSSEEYADMLKVCSENGVTFMVHQNRRWDADFLTVKRMYDQRTLGEITRIESRVQGANGVPGDWRKFKETGGGMMLDWGVHLIDQAVVMLPELPQTVQCSFSYAAGFEVEDGFHLLLTYSDGLIYEIVVETNCFLPLPRWMVYGKDGTAVINDWDLHGKIIKPVYCKDLQIAGIKAGNGFTKTMAYRSPESVTESDLDRVFPAERAFYTEFYEVAVNGKQPYIRAEQVMSVIKIMETAFRSAKENKIITFNK